MKHPLSTKILIIAGVFLLTLLLFKLLQNQMVFDNTLGRIAFTYSNTSDTASVMDTAHITKTNKSFTTFDEAHFLHWDVVFYKYMAEHGYGRDDSWPGAGTYAFSPLFPFIWWLSHLPAPFISVLNFLLFAISLVILSKLFLAPEDFSRFDRACLFALALSLPSVFSFYLPYCEASFIFTLSVALWGLFRGKYWIFFVGMLAFTLSRPSFLIVAMAIICTDIYFYLLHRNSKLFWRELGKKLLPIGIGIAISFIIHFIYSGSFVKMFEVHSRFLDHNFQLPTTITDWSTESYGMNVFAICCIAIPSILILPIFMRRLYNMGNPALISLFARNTKKDYLYVLSIVYFIGSFLFVMLTQGGNLNGLHRYIMISPFFYIFFFIIIQKAKPYTITLLILMMLPWAILGYLLLIHGPYQHHLSFLDGGYFLLCLTLLYFLLFNKLKRRPKLIFLLILIFCNTIWTCYLFNHFLNNSFIIA